MTNIDIISGFLGAGKTTLINKLLCGTREKTAILENEFGEIGIDSAFLKTDAPVKEISSGCICCTLSSNFKEGIVDLLKTYRPDRILIEPTGVSVLSGILEICKELERETIDIGGERLLSLRHVITVVDAGEYDELKEGLGEFYFDQLRWARTVFFSHLNGVEKEELESMVTELRELNPTAAFYLEDWYEKDGEEMRLFLRQTEEGKVESAPPGQLHDQGRFTSCAVSNPKKMREEDLSDFGRELSGGRYGKVWRGKGILDVEGRGLCRFDYTPSGFQWEEWRHADQGDNAPRPEAVFIGGEDLDREGLRRRIGRRFRHVAAHRF